MGGKKGTGINTKVAAANEKKAAAQAIKDNAKSRQEEAALSAEWSKGANSRKSARDEAANEKADEAARKKREKAELLAAEEAALGSGGKGKVAGMDAKQLKKKKKKGGDDLSFLEDSLVSGADKKLKKKKAEEKAKKEKEERDRLEKTKREAEAAAGMEFGNGISNMVDHLNIGTDGQLEKNVNKDLNVDELAGPGIDGANSIFGFAGAPEKNPKIKAAHREYEARVLDEYREQYPGLKLSQLKERIWEAFKKSPENPMNQLPGGGGK